MFRENFEILKDGVPESIANVVNMRKREVIETTDRLRDLKSYLLHHEALPNIHTDPFNPAILFKRSLGGTSQDPANRGTQSGMSHSTSQIQLQRRMAIKPLNLTHTSNSGNKARTDSVLRGRGEFSAEKPNWFSKISQDLSPEKTASRLPSLKQSPVKHNNNDQSKELLKKTLQRNTSLPNFGSSIVTRVRGNKEDDDEDMLNLQSSLVSIFKVKDDETKKKKKKAKLNKRNSRRGSMIPGIDQTIYEDVNGVGLGPLLKKIDSYLWKEANTQFVQNLESQHVPEIERILEKYTSGRDPNEFHWEIDSDLVKIREENILAYYTYKHKLFKSLNKKKPSSIQQKY